MARRYAERGARVCVVGRREALLDEVVEECRRAANSSAVETGIVGLRGDFTNAGDMVRVRAELLTRTFLRCPSMRDIDRHSHLVYIGWGGLDTLVVSAGVSALQPLLAVAGADCKGSALTPMHTTLEGIQKTSDVSLAAIKGNYTGPLIAAVTFVSSDSFIPIAGLHLPSDSNALGDLEVSKHRTHKHPGFHNPRANAVALRLDQGSWSHPLPVTRHRTSSNHLYPLHARNSRRRLPCICRRLWTRT
jgi:hypothetical protein